MDKNKFNYATHEIDSLEDEKYRSNKVDLVISIGGDGTALKAMRIAWQLNSPLINIGPVSLIHTLSVLQIINIIFCTYALFFLSNFLIAFLEL